MKNKEINASKIYSPVGNLAERAKNATWQLAEILKIKICERQIKRACC